MAWTRGSAPQAPPLAGRGPGGCRRAGRGPRSSGGSRAASATRGCPLAEAPSTLPIAPIGRTFSCSSTNPNLIGWPPEDERRLSRGMARSILARSGSRLRRASSAARSAGDEPAVAAVAARRRHSRLGELLAPAPRHRLVQPPLIRPRDDRHPARAHPLHRLAPCTPRGTPAVVAPRPSHTPPRPPHPARKRPPNQGRINACGGRHRGPRQPGHVRDRAPREPRSVEPRGREGRRPPASRRGDERTPRNSPSKLWGAEVMTHRAPAPLARVADHESADRCVPSGCTPCGGGAWGPRCGGQRSRG